MWDGIRLCYRLNGVHAFRIKFENEFDRTLIIVGLTDVVVASPQVNYIFQDAHKENDSHL
jgi:hypothetical protein